MNILSTQNTSISALAPQKIDVAAGNPQPAPAQPTSAQPAPASEAGTSAVQEAKPAQKTPPKDDELKAAVSAINDFIKSVNNGLQFSVDDDTGKSIVKVVDNSTKAVLRQIPSEEALSIAKALDKMQGLLVQQKA